MLDAYCLYSQSMYITWTLALFMSYSLLSILYMPNTKAFIKRDGLNEFIFLPYVTCPLISCQYLQFLQQKSIHRLEAYKF